MLRPILKVGEFKIKNLDAKQDLLNQNPLPPTAKAKEQQQNINAELNSQKLVFNNQDQNGLNLNISKNNTNAKKPWFGPLSNYWKAFLINVGTGVGAALVDTAVYSMPVGDSPGYGLPIGAYMGLGLIGYPLLRYQAHLRFLKKNGRSYGQWITEREKHVKNYRTNNSSKGAARSEYLQDSHNNLKLQNYLKSQDQDREADRSYENSVLGVPTELQTYIPSSFITSNIAWILTHLLIGYVGGKKNPED